MLAKVIGEEHLTVTVTDNKALVMLTEAIAPEMIVGKVWILTVDQPTLTVVVEELMTLTVVEVQILTLEEVVELTAEVVEVEILIAVVVRASMVIMAVTVPPGMTKITRAITWQYPCPERPETAPGRAAACPSASPRKDRGLVVENLY